MSRRRLTLGIGAYAFDKIVVALVQLATVPVLANAWGLSLYGTWAMIMTVPTFLVLSDFGIVNSAAARMIRFVSREEWHKARAALHTAWLATLIMVVIVAGTIGFAVLSLPSGWLPNSGTFGPNDARITILALMTYGLLTVLSRLNTAVFRANMRYAFASLCSTSFYLFENVVVVVLAASGGGLVDAAIGLLGARIVVIVGLLIVTRMESPQLRPGFSAISLDEWSDMWRPALAASALGFGQAGYLQGSVLILGWSVGAAAVPAFVAVRTISRLGVQIATLVSIPVMQEFGNAMGRDERSRAGRYFGLVAAVAMAQAMLTSAGLVIFGKSFILVWTHGAIEADQWLINLMAVSSLAAIFWSPLSNLILAVNQQHSFSYANLLGSCVGLCLIYFCAPILGIVSGGLSFALVDVVTVTAVAIFIVRHWLVDPEFRHGAMVMSRDLFSPAKLFSSLRKAH